MKQLCNIVGCLKVHLAKGLCSAHYAVKHYQDNKEHKRKVKRAWVEKNKEYVKTLKRSNHYLREFGITLKDYEDVLKLQNYRCKLCDSSSSKSKRNTGFQVDHCHKTGIIRGLLCVPCNLGLGHFQDNPKLLIKAANYLDHSRLK